MESLQGQFLAASSDLLDPNFLHTVVLIVQHGDDGALGLVLNRRTNTTLRHAWSQIDETPCVRDDLLYLGGPVAGPLMAVHDDLTVMDLEILPGLYYSAEADALRQLADDEQRQVRFFVGHAGWGPGQLENELAEGSWLVGPATNETVFSSSDDVWQRVSRQIVGTSLISALNIKHVPKAPDLN